MSRAETSVLVVGAGPVGLTASLLLTRQGIPHVVVDRRSGPHRAPQAHVVNPRTLEVLRQIGIDTDRLRRMATVPEDGGYVSWVTTLTGPELGRMTYERQDDEVLAVTPEPIMNLPQHDLEPVLLEVATPSPLASIHWRNEWVSMDRDASGVTSRVVDHETGDTREIRSRWVLAADGAGSPVRKQLAIPLAGPERLQSFVMIHFEANLRPLVRERPAIIYWTLDPGSLGSFIAHDIDRTWVFMHPFDPDAEAADGFDPARCEAIVRRAIGRSDVSLTIRDVSPWHMTSQVATRYRDDRVFLIGDSAHRFPPAGGMGMNTGIQDVHNLVWKLRFVDEGWADAALLDTYDTERRPVAQRNADQSLANALRMIEMFASLGLDADVEASRHRLDSLLATPDGRARIASAIADQRDHFDMLGLQLGFSYDSPAVLSDGTPSMDATVSDPKPSARPGRRLPHAWIERSGTRCSTLDLIAPDAMTLIAGPDWPEPPRFAPAAPQVRVLRAGRDFSDPGETWLATCDVGRDGCLLVRPDQHVAWRDPQGEGDAMSALERASLRHP